MKQPGISRLFILVCIAVLFASYGVGLGVRKIRFAEGETKAAAAAETEEPADKPESNEDEVVADTEASLEPSEELEELAEEPYEEPAEEFAARPGHPEGTRMMGGQMRERFQHMAEEERARMEVEVAKAQLDQENYEHVQEIWPNLPEEVREEIRDIQERWPIMPEEERDSYRARSLEVFGGQSSGGER